MVARAAPAMVLGAWSTGLGSKDLLIRVGGQVQRQGPPNVTCPPARPQSFVIFFKEKCHLLRATYFQYDLYSVYTGRQHFQLRKYLDIL